MKIQLNLEGKIQKIDGKKRIVFDKPEYYKQQVGQYYEGQKVVVNIKNKSFQRSGQQNKYWHGICFPILAELTGFTEMEIKEVCKKKFIKPRVKSLQGKSIEIPRGTSEIDKSEGVEFTKELIKLALELGGKIPTPAESGYIK